MGEAAARGADVVILTDDNPRTEDPAAIRAELAAGVRRGPDVAVVEIGDRRAAIEEAVARAHAGDVILVAGKGSEQGQEIEGQMVPFDDRVVLRESLAGRRRGEGR